MTFRERLAINAAPIPLRLILAVTFLWAGLGKVVNDAPFQGGAAATLANLGVDMGLDAPPQRNAPAPAPALEPTPEPEASTGDTAPTTPEAGVDPELPGESETESPEPEAAAAPEPEQAVNPARFEASDFPEPVNKPALYGLALLMHGAANPQPADDGTTPDAIWPEQLGGAPWVVVMAWFAAITEILAGLFVLIGLMTRLSALALAGTMLTAAWLTEMGPAVQSGTALLGFLPGHDLTNLGAWTKFLWQMALLCAAVSLLFAGPGWPSVDRAMSARRASGKKAASKKAEDDEEDYDEEEDDEDDYE
ncbi:MAG: DoxX family protein [Planctomycetota bacterium]